MWKDSVTLTFETTEYKKGVKPVKKKADTKGVPANIKSVRGSEFYAANADNIKTDKIIELMSANYGGQTLITDEATGTKYRFIRSYYTRNGDRIELTVTDISAR